MGKEGVLLELVARRLRLSRLASRSELLVALYGGPTAMDWLRFVNWVSSRNVVVSARWQ